MARNLSTVDNRQGYAYVVLAREYEKHCSYGWFAALRNVGAAPGKDQWISEGMALWAMLGGDDTHDDVNRIVKVMSQGLYDANKHRLRHVGHGDRRVTVMDVPTDPGLLPREGDTLLPEPNPYAELLVRRLSEWLVQGQTACKRGHDLADAYTYPNGRRQCRTCAKQRANGGTLDAVVPGHRRRNALTGVQRQVFDAMWETGSGSSAVLQRATGLEYGAVQSAVKMIRRKAEHFLDLWEYPPNIEGLNSKRTAGAQ